jgi:hypothetical protein
MRLLALALLMLACSACGSDRYGYWKGTYTGTMSGTPFTADITILLHQNSDGKDTGFWSSSDSGDSFSLGSFQTDGDDDELAVTFDQSGTRCGGELTGAIRISDGTMEGEMAGTTVDDGGEAGLPFGIACGALTGEFTLTKSDD